MSGAYVVLEGGDGCGKSTQAERLCGWLREGAQRVVRHVREPGSTPLASSLREILLRDVGRDIEPVTEALLFSAARRELLQKQIEPALSQDEVVVSERSFVSTLVYQVLAPIEEVERVPMTVAVEMAKAVHENTWPDLVLILDLGGKAGQDRVEARAQGVDRIEARGQAFADRVREGFLEIATSSVLAEVLGGSDRIRVVDAVGSVEEVHGRIRDAVAPLVSPDEGEIQ